MTSYNKILVTCFCIIGWAQPVYAEIIDDIGGTVEAELDGKIIHFPALKTDIHVDIKGDLANVKVTQIFENPTNAAMHARYLFPMNKDSAVHSMIMEVGDEIIKAKIKRKEEAKKTFEAAKVEGKTASLLTQNRPNMFTQKIANLMPSMPITVTLEYTQSIPKVDNAYELVVPLVVGPRYNPLGIGESPDLIDDGVSYGKVESTSRSAFGVWELEEKVDYPDVTGLTLPDTIDAARVSIRVDMDSDIAIQDVFSETHDISVRGNDKTKTIALQKHRVIDNADFVLRYSLSGQSTKAGFLATNENGEGYFSLMIEPPELPNDKDITSREMVFVLDTSGSMNGRPIDASKTFMRHALENLRQGDSFRIIRFSDNATEYASVPVPATSENIKDGLRYVQSLSANGGTNIPLAISQAFAAPEMDNKLRIVVFLTDGYIGNEASVLKQIAGVIGDARIYAFGVGTSVNRYLLAEMGRRGRGFSRFIDPTEDIHDAAISLAKKLNAPVLTDIDIDWGDLDVVDITPDVIPDLFAGNTIRVQGRFKGAGTHLVRVNGKVQGRKASLPVQVTLPAANDNQDDGKAIPIIWARSRVSDLMRHINTPDSVRYVTDTDDELKEKVVQLGLGFSLMTQWTSFVAVSEKLYNKDTEKTRSATVPLPMVKGVTNLVYGQSFSGGSVPEPASTGGLIVLGGIAAAAMRRKKRKSDKVV